MNIIPPQISGNSQNIGVIPPGGNFTIRQSGYVYLERFSILEDHLDLFGCRAAVLAHVRAATKGARTAQMHVALSSFVLVQDDGQSADIIFSPLDQYTLDTVGPERAICILHSTVPIPE
jgi:hypothetical protein